MLTEMLQTDWALQASGGGGSPSLETNPPPDNTKFPQDQRITTTRMTTAKDIGQPNTPWSTRATKKQSKH